jgi:hypothetical protein
VSSPGEKILAGEMLAGLTLTAVAHVWKAGQAGAKTDGAKVDPSLPAPHQVLGITFLYAGLAAVAMFGPQPARLAAGVGGLVLLAIFLKTATSVFGALGVTIPTDASPALSTPGTGVAVV